MRSAPWRLALWILALVFAAPLAAQSALLFSNSFETDAASQIGIVRAQPDGAIAPPIAIPSALVTYLKPALGTDVAGFFIQGSAPGPALFVAVDPSSLVPAVQRGDRVSFAADAIATVGGLRQITAISGYLREASGVALAPLVKDVSAATDLVTAVDTYESELIGISGVLDSAFASSGAAHVSATLSTAGVVANPSLRLRVPSTLADGVDLAQGCALTAAAIPLWRFNAQAQPSSYAATDFTLLDCPAPRVLSAQALSLTSVRVQFDRRIAAASVNANGSQFVFNGGLTATAASVAGREVVLTTSQQSSLTAYTVTVAASVTDLAGKGVDASANSAGFNGFALLASLLLNEVNANIASSRDLVELRAITSGTINGIQLVQGPAAGGGGTVLATMPNTIVATGDLIVVHLAPTGETSETASQTQCTDLACFAFAWDVRGGATGITYSNQVLALRSPIDASLMDAVPFALNTGTPPAAFPTTLQFIQGLGLWSPANCSGAPCTYVSSPTAVDVAVLWNGLATTATGASVSRNAAVDTNSDSDWQVGLQSFGAANF